MRARFGNRMPAVKIVAGPLVLAVTVGVLQAAGTTAAHASTSCKPTSAIAARAGRAAARPEFVVRHHATLTLGGRTVVIRGQLKDACAGVRVRLQQRSRHGWRQLESSRVNRHGRFDLDYRAPELGTVGLRVDFGGGHGLHPAAASVGAVTAMHPVVASWYYDDTGATGCGFQATYGVANKTLPCGTKVTLSYGGRTVVATVDDRGPYIPGRSYDLGINTRNALGMNDGVVTLLASS